MDALRTADRLLTENEQRAGGRHGVLRVVAIDAATGVTVVDGRMVDAPHVKLAQRIIAIA